MEAFPYMSKGFIHRVCYFSEFLLTLTVLWWSYTVFSKCGERSRIPTFAAVLIFLAAPFSPYFTYLWNNCGRLDVFLIIIIFLQSMLFICKPRGYNMLIIELSVFGMLIHTGNTFMYFPFSEALLLCSALTDGTSTGSDDDKISLYGNFDYERPETPSIKRFFPAALNLLVAILLFSCFHFTSLVKRNLTAETMLADMQQRTDIDLSIIKENLDTWYFMDAAEYVQYQRDYMGGRISLLLEPSVLFPLLITLILLLPVIYTIFILWRDTIRSTEDGLQRVIYLLCAFSWLTLIPEFLMETDMGRYVAAGFMSQALLLFTLYASGDCNIKSALDKFCICVSEKQALWIFFAIETISLGYLKDVSTLDIAERIWGWMR